MNAAQTGNKHNVTLLLFIRQTVKMPTSCKDKIAIKLHRNRKGWDVKKICEDTLKEYSQSNSH